MRMWPELFPTQLVGSYHKPHWLADHGQVYTKEGSWWRVEADHLKTAQDDAVRLAVFDQNRAGIDYATDGEQRRQTFSGHFNSLGGIDSENPLKFTNFHNDITPYLEMRTQAKGVGADIKKDVKTAKAPEVLFPSIRAPITWPGPMVVEDAEFLTHIAARKIKVTVIGPVTLAYRLVDSGIYDTHADLVFAIARAMNKEMRALEKAGVDLIQIDEPEVHFRLSQCQDFTIEAINRMVDGVNAMTAVHVCYGYSKNIAYKQASPVYPKAVALIAQSDVGAISIEYAQPGHTPDLLKSLGDKNVIMGVLNLDPMGEVETVNGIVDMVSDAMTVMPGERISLAPDCGMWFLPRDFAFSKLKAMCEAADMLKNRLNGF